MREYAIKLDLLNKEYNFDTMWYMQGDIGNKLHINLFENDVPIDLSGMRVVAYLENKNKQTSQKDVTILNALNGECELEITNSILSVPGKIKIEIKLYKGEELKQTFYTFQIVSLKTIDIGEAIDSFTELDIINTILSNMNSIDTLKVALGETNTSLIEKFNVAMQSVGEVSSSLNDKIGVLQQEVRGNIESLTSEVNSSISALESNVNSSISTLELNVNNSISALELDVNTSIENINNTVNSGLEAVTTSVNNSIGEVKEQVQTSITNLGDTVDTKILAINKKIEDTVATINQQLGTINEFITQSISDLDNNKVDIIVSDVEPDISNIKMGTIWIKPKIGE